MMTPVLETALDLAMTVGVLAVLGVGIALILPSDLRAKPPHSTQAGGADPGQDG